MVSLRPSTPTPSSSLISATTFAPPIPATPPPVETKPVVSSASGENRIHGMPPGASEDKNETIPATPANKPQPLLSKPPKPPSKTPAKTVKPATKRNIAKTAPSDAEANKPEKTEKVPESKLLQSETKDLLTRLQDTNRRGGAGRRCASYKPTLQELRSVSFSDYIRGEVLGVPLPGWEFFYVFEEKITKGVRSDKGAKRPRTGESPVGCSTCVVGGNNPVAGGASTERSSLPATPAPRRPLEKNVHGATPDLIPSPADGSTTGFGTLGAGESRESPQPLQPLGQTAQPVATQAPLVPQPPVVEPMVFPLKKKPPPMERTLTMRTRSQSRAIVKLRNGGINGNAVDENSSSSTTKNEKPENIYSRPKRKEVPIKDMDLQPKKYEMCWYKLRDGIAKISLPAGFWAKVDVTARGRLWAKGSKLGDTVIPAPIKQCISGIGGVYQYTLIEQPPITVANYRSQADEYRKRQIGKEFDTEDSDEFFDELAHKFWKRLGPTMEPAVYGADMEGTLFKDAHATGWNVDRLESCLQLLRADAVGGDRDDEVFHVPGVTSAYLYFGMWASAFAAHTEDMNLLSINYLHAGSPKYWYAIAAEDSKRFENLARSHFPGQASECNEFMRHKRCMLSPSILKKAGISYTTCIQRPGDAIITFPGSYHFGFNTGFNIAESTNFAVPEWIPIGEKASFCMCVPHSVRIQMNRLKSLLDDYEKETLYRSNMGLKKLSYSAWAKQEAKRLKKVSAANSSRKADDSVLRENSLESLTLPTTLNSGIAVEVTKELVTPNKRKQKSYKRKEYNEWRLAKRVRPSAFVPNTDVICLVCCNDSNATGIVEPRGVKDYEFFVGNIVKLVDGHVKVHLTGLTKKEDIWYEQDSSHLFLDAGKTDAPSSDEDVDDDSFKSETPQFHSNQKKRSK